MPASAVLSHPAARLSPVPPDAALATLAALDPEQRAAVLAPAPVCILAGAGTGKTRTITHRVAHAALTGAALPEHVYL